MVEESDDTGGAAEHGVYPRFLHSLLALDEGVLYLIVTHLEVLVAQPVFIVLLLLVFFTVFCRAVNLVWVSLLTT